MKRERERAEEYKGSEREVIEEERTSVEEVINDREIKHVKRKERERGEKYSRGRHGKRVTTQTIVIVKIFRIA